MFGSIKSENPIKMWNMAVIFRQVQLSEDKKDSTLHLFEKAAMLFKLSPWSEMPECQLDLGLIYLNGFGVDIDTTQALPFITKAAENGSAHAQYILGNMLINGTDKIKNIQTGLK